MRRIWLYVAAAVFTAVAASASENKPVFDAGMSLSGGSHNYHGSSFFGDVEGTGSLRPYGWAELDLDSYLDMFTFGGGVWKDFGRASRAKAGLGADLGHVKNSEGTDSAVVFESGLETDFSRSTLGAQYKVTAGSIGGPSGPSAFSQNLRMNSTGSSGGMGGRGGGAGGTKVASYNYNEFSAYYRFPIGPTRLTLKMALGWPSYAQSIKDETLAFRFPAVSSLWVTTAATAEQQASDSRSYFSAGFFYLF